MEKIIEDMNNEFGPAKNKARKTLRVVVAAIIGAAALAFVVDKVKTSDSTE